MAKNCRSSAVRHIGHGDDPIPITVKVTKIDRTEGEVDVDIAVDQHACLRLPRVRASVSNVLVRASDVNRRKRGLTLVVNTLTSRVAGGR